MIQAVFFDFDGTLADTAPDLVNAANQQRLYAGLSPLPFEALRSSSSQGAIGLLKTALNLTPEDPLYEATREQFILDYTKCMTDKTALFDGIDTLLTTLEEKGLRWGIVTNKAERLSFPIFRHLNLEQRSAANICGDTAARPKPYADPLLLAAEKAGVLPAHCIYVGDDERDIQAGKAAGMKTIAVTYGYSPTPELIPQWGADIIVDSPDALLATILGMVDTPIQSV
ncbi:HAD-IA family hydrolase [Pelistega ratti]|uniref:HAD-IA family hydrolase n=1 Tax=Pelistega ratti TaxID=2652177 RepID=UPI00135A66CD|nr:HAD-IA family hydrolase [Pelistega ratti]